MLKILFTSVGRRVELIQAFRNAAQINRINLQLWGTDINESAPALFFCDYTKKTVRIKDERYIPQLLDLCKEERINAVIPTIDTDLLILSENREKFAKIGTRVIVSDLAKIKISRDKRYTADYFNAIGLASPIPVDNYKKYSGGFPAFIKPKDGSSSISAYKVNNMEELKTYSSNIQDYIVQTYISGLEYTVDIFCDFEGEPIYITPRRRVAVRAGEVLKSEIVQDETIIKEVQQLVNNFKPVGPITVQLIRQESTEKDYYIEINPRFGGGAPLSMKAGADSAEALLMLLLGRKMEYISNAAIKQTVFSRFDQSVCSSFIFCHVKAIVFDLDDTLYNEIDYVKSGFLFLANTVLARYSGAYKMLLSFFKKKKNAIDETLKELGIYSDELKEKCVCAYRNHIPKLTLHSEIKSLLTELRRRKILIGIISDGRPEGQWNKIKALGLEKYVDHIIITDELGGSQFRKPNDIAYRIMQQFFLVHFREMMYVGDNLTKDFLAPKQLGMQYVLYDNNKGLYRTSNCCIPTIKYLSELLLKLDQKS